MNRWQVTALCLILLVVQTSLVSALPVGAASPSPLNEARRVDLSWVAPVGCPSEDEVEHEIQRLLATSADHQNIDVRMRVTRGGDGVYVLTFEMHAPVGGNRSLEHKDCGAVARAAALVVALAIDADAVAVIEEREPLAEAAPDIAASNEPASTPEALVPPTPVSVARNDVGTPDKDETGADAPNGPVDDSFSFHVALGAHVEATFAPRAAWGPVVAAGIGNRWASAELLLGAIPGYIVTDPATDVGAKFESLWVEADVCAGMLRRMVNVAVCVAGREYWIRATGRGVDEVLEPTTAVFAMAAGPLLALQLGSWRLLGVLNGVVPLARPEFVVDNSERSVFRPPKVGLSGRVALSLTL